MKMARESGRGVEVTASARCQGGVEVGIEA